MPEAFLPLTDFVNEAKSEPSAHPLDKPVARWTEEEVLNGEIVEAGVVILRTRAPFTELRVVSAATIPSKPFVGSGIESLLSFGNDTFFIKGSNI